MRGFRIELGEIDAALQRHPSVDFAVTIGARDRRGRDRAGRPTWSPSRAPTVDTDGAASLVAEHLPAYMVPAAVDGAGRDSADPGRQAGPKALPEPDFARRATVTAAHRAPGERDLLADAVRRGARAGRGRASTIRFFALGGDSIVSIQLVSRAKAAGLVFTPAGGLRTQDGRRAGRGRRASTERRGAGRTARRRRRRGAAHPDRARDGRARRHLRPVHAGRAASGCPPASTARGSPRRCRPCWTTTICCASRSLRRTDGRLGMDGRRTSARSTPTTLIAPWSTSRHRRRACDRGPDTMPPDRLDPDRGRCCAVRHDRARRRPARLCWLVAAPPRRSTASPGGSWCRTWPPLALRRPALDPGRHLHAALGARLRSRTPPRASTNCRSGRRILGDTRSVLASRRSPPLDPAVDVVSHRGAMSDGRCPPTSHARAAPRCPSDSTAAPTTDCSPRWPWPCARWRRTHRRPC